MPSFDVVSQVPWNEVDNALLQAQKEIAQRFDFKDTHTEVEKGKDVLTIRSGSEDRAKAALTVLQEKLVKRKVSLKFVDPQDPKPTGKGGALIEVKVKQGIDTENAKKIVAAIKEAKLKVTAAIQDAQVRVTGKNKDDLQSTIQLVRGLDVGLELQFINFRD
jgi:uncharacterized protein YajQ (UPF0234 family)